jgi:hypothetical protein
MDEQELDAIVDQYRAEIMIPLWTALGDAIDVAHDRLVTKGVEEDRIQRVLTSELCLLLAKMVLMSDNKLPRISVRKPH